MMLIIIWSCYEGKRVFAAVVRKRTRDGGSRVTTGKERRFPSGAYGKWQCKNALAIRVEPRGNSRPYAEIKQHRDGSFFVAYLVNDNTFWRCML